MKQDHLIINCDGASRGNPGPAASAFNVETKGGESIFHDSKYLGNNTNNVAEYYAILLALTWLQNQGSVNKVDFILDSELAVKQLNGLYKVKSPNLIPLYQKVIALKNSLSIKISFIHVKRHKNKIADKLANQELDKHQK